MPAAFSSVAAFFSSGSIDLQCVHHGAVNATSRPPGWLACTIRFGSSSTITSEPS